MKPPGCGVLLSTRKQRLHVAYGLMTKSGPDSPSSADNDGSGGDTGNNEFSREPAYGCFKSGNFDFLLAPYHATWAEGDIDDISAEVINIDDVFISMQTAQSGENDLLIAGDFNLVPSDLAAAINREIPTVGEGSTLNGSGERTQKPLRSPDYFEPR